MKRGTHKDWRKRWFKRYRRVKADGFIQDGEEKGQMDRRDGRDLLPVLAECICEHTCRTCAGPLSTLTWL